MLKKIGQAVIFGLFCAILILFVAPLVQHKGNIFSFSALTKPNIASYSSAVKLASPAVVNVYNRNFSSENAMFEVKNLGSGVIMSNDGYILTNKHVIEDADQIVIALQNGLISADVKLVGDDSLTDLAVLKIDAENLPTIPQNTERKIEVGDVVLAIGNPLNLGQSITQGIVSAIGRNTLTDSGRQNFIQTDVSINQGNSGGALINSAGELIGINTLRLGKNTNELSEGLNFAIPINLANQIMNKIIKDGRVIRGYFGVSTDLIDTAKLQGYAKGVIIANVNRGGPAAKAGIEAGDLVLKIGDVEALSPSQMMEALADMEPYTTVKVVVQRGNQILNFDVTITELQTQ
ncbi:outer membrane-stress sensor serine endopeptidase DegS [Mannheimia sp. AT1]|uniref:Outer membrane-stress sensor serine endopeptidase DegS n=1 Tax=Mannheimia cairinae TaxID=3025936 RepID=A0ABT5MTE8_9PAST|nr:outer membrane-stress sensor serine endopeptidase DegS [Mannheimia cairinae]MDD0824784.1 outer membrane-stress sensor serine endopeptidase DegS [Mannheimia cairinae]MDD0826286.1 outer membrane-stress sensor serine endopeptidase DegS [Mannheimia cairinae]